MNLHQAPLFSHRPISSYIRSNLLGRGIALSLAALFLLLLPVKEAQAAVQLVKASTLVRHSNNFIAKSPLNNLWDGCTTSTPDCMTSAKGETSFFVEFDFGVLYSLTQARLFGET